MARRNTGTHNRYNEAKHQVLKILYAASRYYSPQELSERTGISIGSMKTLLGNWSEWGYIWRRKEYRIKKNYFCYRYIKQKGMRVFLELDERVRIREATGIFVSLNLKKTVPFEARQKYFEYCQKNGVKA